MSLRARLMTLMLLATLVPALLLAWRFYLDSQLAVQRSEQALVQAADNIVAALDRRVQGTAQLHYGLAHSRVLDDDDRDLCSVYLSDVREAYPQFTGIITVRPDGQLHCDSLRSGRQLDLTDRGYFKRARSGTRELILEPVFGRLTGTAVLQIVYPARRADDTLRFLLVASLNLHQFAEESRRQSMRQDVELVLLDSRGTVMAWTGARAGLPAPGTSIAQGPLFGLARARPQGGSGELADGAGRMQVWGVAAPHASGLHVMLGLPKDTLAADARHGLRQDLLALAAAALLLFTAMWVLAERGLRRPVGRITRMVRALGKGHLGTRIGAPYPRGELGGLMRALDGTAAALQQQREAIDALERQLRQAQKLEAVGTLAGGIAHDFNNIIGAVLGNLALARRDLADGRPADDSLRQIERAAQRARDLVHRIQAFSHADEPERRAQSLRRIVEEAVALVRVALPAGAALRTEVGADPCMVWGDATELHQVVLNLATNAWQALQGRPGTVVVGLEAEVLDADAQRRAPGLAAGPHARLWVSDTGSGIDDATRERIFEPYFTTKVGSGGTGLGLSMVHGIVSAHRGTIVVASRPGLGSTFTVYLPLLAERQAVEREEALRAETAAPPAPPAVPPPPAPNPPAAPSLRAAGAGSGARVLYVDDDEVMTLLVERLLAQAGYAVVCHNDAAAALAALRAEPDAFDVVVSDYNMPLTSGLDLARALAALRPELPVILSSGHIADELPALARECGVRALIGKENLVDELVPTVQRVLGETLVAGTGP
jgi:signal transduction histidine kinase